MIHHFKVHKEENGFWAQCIELPGCFAQGDTMKELQANMKEVLELYFEGEPNGPSIIKFEWHE